MQFNRNSIKAILSLLIKWVSCICLFAILTQSSFIFCQNEATQLKVNFTGQEKSLSEVFDKLESVYGIRFSYASASLADEKVSVKFEEANLEEVMKVLLAGKEMEFKVIENNVLIRKTESYEVDPNENYQSSLHLRGKIGSDENEEYEESQLAYATIRISNSSIGTYSDEDGNFDIEISPEYFNEKLLITYIGYGEQSYEIKELDEEFLMVQLASDPLQFEEVLIVNRVKPMRIVSANNSVEISNGQFQASSSSLAGADLARQIQLLPGICAMDDASADIKIRGSGSDGTLMVLDGMPLYNSSHYYGVFCAVNPYFIDKATIYKNAFPVNFGGKIGGVVELTGREKENDTKNINFITDVNFLTGSAVIELPLSDKAMLAVGGRSSIQNISNSRFYSQNNASVDSINQSMREDIQNQKSNPDFRFYDLNGKFIWQPEKGKKLSLNFFKSDDKYENIYNRKVKQDSKNQIGVNAGETEAWSSLAGSFQFQNKFSNDFEFNSLLYYTSHNNEGNISYDLQKNDNNENTQSKNQKSKQVNELEDIGLDFNLKIPIKDSETTIGLSGVRHDMFYNVEDNGYEILRDREKFLEGSFYLNQSFNLRDKIKLSAGLRSTFYEPMDKLFFSPRVLFGCDLTKGLSIKSSYAFYQQIIREFDYEYRGETRQLWVHSSKRNIPVLKSQNFMLGATAMMKGITFDVEVYRKNLDGLLEFSALNPGGDNNVDLPRDYGLFNGDGFINGMDIMISSSVNKIETMIAYTLSKANQRYKEIDQKQYFPTEDDRRHQFKWINSLETGSLTWGLNFIYASGKPYTDIRLTGQNGSINDISSNTRFSYLPAYTRLDASVEYDLKITSKIRSELYFSVLNVLNAQNVKYIQNVNTVLSQNGDPFNFVMGNESSLLNRTFNLGFKINFE